MSYIRPLFQVPSPVVSAKPKVKKYSKKFMQKFAEVTSVLAY
jgi:hypothetical protein